MGQQDRSFIERFERCIPYHNFREWGPIRECPLPMDKQHPHPHFVRVARASSQVFPSMPSREAKCNICSSGAPVRAPSQTWPHHSKRIVRWRMRVTLRRVDWMFAEEVYGCDRSCVSLPFRTWSGACAHNLPVFSKTTTLNQVR